jgi:flagellar protein FliO/FliZ
MARRASAPFAAMPALVFTAVAASALTVAPAVAADGGRFAVPAAAASGSGAAVGGGAVQLLLSLALVVGAIVLLGWLVRRMRVMPRGRGGALRVVDEIALGAKERAVILEVDGARLVLCVGEGRVALLHRAEAPLQTATATIDAVTGASTGIPAAPPRFADLLQKAIGR